jgi:hypothetical protein
MVKEIRVKSIVESLTHRGFEKRWVEPGGVVVVWSWRTRLFTEDEWHALFPPPWTEPAPPDPV